MYPDAYYRAIYPSTSLSDLIHYASLRLGSNLQNPKAWFLKVIDPNPSEAPNPTSSNSSIRDPSNSDSSEANPGSDEQEIVSFARYLLPPSVLRKLEEEFPRRRLSQEEKARYEREAEEGSDGEGMPRGINAPLLEVVGPVMAKAREAFPGGGGREGISEYFRLRFILS